MIPRKPLILEFQQVALLEEAQTGNGQRRVQAEQAPRGEKRSSLPGEVEPMRQADDSSWVCDIYDRHAPVLNALLVRMLGDATLAESVLVKVFECIINERSQKYREADLASLVCLTRQHALHLLMKLEPSATPTVIRPDGAENLGAGEAMIDGLTPRQWELVEAAFYSGTSVAELATRYDVPKDWVRSSLDRALERLMQNQCERRTP